MKILIASPIYPEAIESLRKQHDVVCAFNAKEDILKTQIMGCKVLICRSGVQISADVMSNSPDLELIVRAGSGVDNIDLGYVREKGIRLVRVPGPGAKAVAEMSFALMLSLARNVLEADRLTRQGIWAKHELTGYLLTGKVLGIVGAGNIGSRVGQLGSAWGMQVLGCVEHSSIEAAERLLQIGIRLADFDQLLAESDFVSLHVPLKESTRNLMDGEAIARMKRGAFLINLARGGVVDELALYDALKNGHLRGAALDVHASEGNGNLSPLVNLPNVILTPHIGAGTFDSQREIGEIVIRTVADFWEERMTAHQSTETISTLIQ